MSPRIAYNLSKKLANRIAEFGEKKSYWIEREELLEFILLELGEIKEIDVDQGDGTFKATVKFMDKTFVYVGSQVEVS